MAQGTVGSTSGKAVTLKNGWVGDTSGKARKIVKGWVGDASGKARVCYSSGMKIIPRTISLTYKSNVGYTNYIDDGETAVNVVANNLPAKSVDAIAFISGKFGCTISNGYSSSIGGYDVGFYVSDDGIMWEEKGRFVLTGYGSGSAVLVEAPNGTIYYSRYSGSYTLGTLPTGSGDKSWTDSYNYNLIYSKDGGSTWTTTTYALDYYFHGSPSRYQKALTGSHLMHSMVIISTGETLIWTNYKAGIVIDKGGNISASNSTSGTPAYKYYFNTRYQNQGGYDSDNEGVISYNDNTEMITDGTNYLRVNGYFDALGETYRYTDASGDWSGRTSATNTTAGSPLKAVTYGYATGSAYGGGKIVLGIATHDEDGTSSYSRHKQMWVSTSNLSSNDLTWTKSTGLRISFCIFDGTRYWGKVTGMTTLYYSNDGLTWTQYSTTNVAGAMAHGSFCGGRISI